MIKILICRTDALGDLITALPAIQSLKINYPAIEIDVLIRAINAPVLNSHPAIHAVHHIEQTGSDFLKRQHYDAAFTMLYTTAIGRLLKKAAIPLRIGPLSKLSSFFYLNKLIRQHRSESCQTEAEYNVDLIKAAFPAVTALRPVIANKGIKPAIPLPLRYAVFAVQSRGSALNISQDDYEQIIARTALQIPVVLTGMCDTPFETDLSQRYGNCINLCGKTSLDELIFVVSGASLVVAPSSGTVHLANALGRKIVAFYPPAKAMSPKRWAPYGYEGKIFCADIDCGRFCKKSKGCAIECMKFDIDSVAGTIEIFLSE